MFFFNIFFSLLQVDKHELLNGDVLETKWSLAKVSKAKDWEKWIEKYLQRLQEEKGILLSAINYENLGTPQHSNFLCTIKHHPLLFVMWKSEKKKQINTL